MAMLNKLLPKGYKFDFLDVIRRQMEVHQKRVSSLANYNKSKQQEIQNEVKTKKIMQKYNQKKQKEQEKLKEMQIQMIENKNKLLTELQEKGVDLPQAMKHTDNKRARPDGGRDGLSSGDRVQESSNTQQ